MDDYIIEEGNLRFDFTNCGKPIKFDKQNNSGLYAVDFAVFDRNFNKNSSLFIEIKDYQNPNTSHIQQKNSYNMLLKVIQSEESVFALKMGSKIKDSLLSLYAKGESFQKEIIYLLFINFDDLTAAERQLLFDKIRGYVPTGLNNKERFTSFSTIQFRIVDKKMLHKKYGIICTSKEQPLT